MATHATDQLDIAYDDAGPTDGPVVVLLHGWPDDATTWARVAPALRAAGLRTIAPTLRGFGATRFRAAAAPRTGDAAILAMDAIALLDGLGIARFSVAGHDWGSSIAEALAVGWPDRVRRIAMLSSPSRLGGLPTPNFDQAQRYWYHWFMATERGAQAVRDDRRGFARVMWELWSPPGWFDEATFQSVSAAFDNPDWAEVTIHSYRARWGQAEADPASQWLDDKVKVTGQLALPTLFLHGEADGVVPPSASAAMAGKFSGPFERVALPGIGHFPTREASDAVAAHLLAHFGDALARPGGGS